MVVGIDDTIERRWGPKIKARGIYRDPVRSSRGHFVKASGLRWLCVMLLAPIPWADCVWALPFLTVLAPRTSMLSGAGSATRSSPTGPGRRCSDRALAARAAADRRGRQQLRSHRTAPRLLPPPDHDHPAAPRCRAVRTTTATPAGHARPASGKGARLPSLAERLADPAHPLAAAPVDHWYGRSERRLEIVSGTALWHHPGMRVPIRWVLVRDPEGEKEPQAFLCTDLEADPLEHPALVRPALALETTFEEARRHLGVETQRQWSDLAILRTTPALFGLFSLVTLWATRLAAERSILPDCVCWYPKHYATFSDALAAVRSRLWTSAT